MIFKKQKGVGNRFMFPSLLFVFTADGFLKSENGGYMKTVKILVVSAALIFSCGVFGAPSSSNAALAVSNPSCSDIQAACRYYGLNCGGWIEWNPERCDKAFYTCISFVCRAL